MSPSGQGKDFLNREYPHNPPVLPVVLREVPVGLNFGENPKSLHIPERVSDDSSLFLQGFVEEPKANLLQGFPDKG